MAGLWILLTHARTDQHTATPRLLVDDDYEALFCYVHRTSTNFKAGGLDLAVADSLELIMKRALENLTTSELERELPQRESLLVLFLGSPFSLRLL